jgi:RHS repeat-associated protein
MTYERQAGTNVLASVLDPRGRRTGYVYDPSGNILSVTQLQGTADAITTTYEYEPQFNNMTRVTDALGRKLVYTYNAQGDLTKVTDGQGRSVSTTYNSAGQVSTVTDQLQRTFQFSYENGDLVTVTDPLGRTVTRFTDGAGRLLAFTNPLGKTTRFEYDVFNQLTKVRDPLDGVTEFTRDFNGNLTQVKDSRNKIISYTYDAMDRLLTRTDALQGVSSVEQFEYDKTGNITKITDRRGKVTVYNYDSLGRRTFAGFGNVGGSYESTVNFTYDNGNRLRQVTDSLSGTITLDLDELDSLTSIATPQGTVTYTNDDIGRRTGMSVPGQSAISYTYNDADQITSITQGSTVVSFAYDAANQLTRMTQPNGLVTDYEYDLASRLIGATYKNGSTVLGDLTYEYDAAGRRTKIGGTFARTNLPPSLASATYNDANRLTQRGSATFNYDAEGNLTSDGANTYTWDARNQLTSISGPGLSVSFLYDSFGRRTGKTVNGVSTSYLYDDLNVVQELSGATPTANMLTFDVDEVFTRTDAAGSFGYLLDALGSTVALADSSGAIQTSYTYEPFGNTTTSGAGSNSSQFTGRESDPAGLYYYRSRYYSPTLQRFISEDPIGIAGGINQYAYVNNDPINLSDPSGLWPTRVLPTHQNSADRVLRDRISPYELELLKDGLYHADDHETQDVGDSYKHAMTPGGQSKTEARKDANDFVRDNINKARNSRSIEDSMKYLSNAMHAMQDATSPAHANFRKYYGGRMELYLHIFQEFFDPKEGSNLDRATDLAYKYYTGQLPMPRDFFENLCTDNGTDHYYRTHPR